MDGHRKFVFVKSKDHNDHADYKRKAIRNILKQNTHDFCENTTLHGLRYVVNKELFSFERIFFALSFLAACIAAALFIWNVYNKWETTPFIFNTDHRSTFITEHPFPAVTICNMNMASKRRAEKFENNTVEYAMLETLCKRKSNNTLLDTIVDWDALDKFIKNISQPCEDMLLACRFGDVPFNCKDFFWGAIMEEGLCCRFNMVHPKFLYHDVSAFNWTFHNGYEAVEWSSERGYQKNLPKKFIPQLAVGSGEALGLSVTLNVEKDDYYCSTSNSLGFKVALHSPTEAPNMRDIGLLLAPGTETKLRITTDKVDTDQSLRSIDKNKRKCIFENEQRLSFFKYYTQRNCEIECQAAFVIEACDCVRFYMPKIFGITKTCSLKAEECIRKLREVYIAKRGCMECLPSCFDLSYNSDFFSTQLSHDGFKITNEIVQNISSAYAEENIAILNMFYKEKTFRSSKRSSYIGFTDFLSSVGGLMSLFLGFSFISIAEFFYFAIIRPTRMIHQKLSAKDSGSHKNLTSPLQYKSRRRLSEHFGPHARVGPLVKPRALQFLN